MSMPIWGKYVRALIIDMAPLGKHLAKHGMKWTSLPMYTFLNTNGYCDNIVMKAHVTMKQSQTFPSGESISLTMLLTLGGQYGCPEGKRSPSRFKIRFCLEKVYSLA